MAPVTIVETSASGRHVILRTGEADSHGWEQTDCLALTEAETLDLIDRLQGALRFLEIDRQRAEAGR